MEQVRKYLKRIGERGDDAEFMVFEASNKKKISFHIHILIPGRRFKNNLHVGAFMRSLSMELQKEFGVDPKTNPFFIRVPNDKMENKGSHSPWECLCKLTL